MEVADKGVIRYRAEVGISRGRGVCLHRGLRCAELGNVYITASLRIGSPLAFSLVAGKIARQPTPRGRGRNPFRLCVLGLGVLCNRRCKSL